MTAQAKSAAARQLLAAGKYAEAIDPLLEAATLAPRDPAILNDLGVAYMASRRFLEARVWFERSLKAEPHAGESHLNLGLVLRHLGDDEGAIAEYEHAARLSPELTLAGEQLGDLFEERGAHASAISAYDKAYASAPATSLGRLCLAKALIAQHRSPEAEAPLQLVTSSSTSSPIAHVLLGRVLQESGRFAEAITSFERALAADPWQSNAYWGLVSSRTMKEADRPWLSELVARLSVDWRSRFAPSVADRHRMMLHFALGKAYDDLGEYPEAWHHFASANALRGRAHPFVRAEVEARITHLIESTPATLATLATLQSATEDDTPILIVGMPRSGTTLVERILSSHPKVHGCGELDFWNDHGPTFASAPAATLLAGQGKLRDDYLRVLERGASDALRATDKMPFNFFWLGLVASIFPRARIVCCKRNAIDTCLSIYTTPFPAAWGFVSDLSDLAWYHRQYERLMEHWRRVLRPGQILDVDYEEVVAHPEASARRLVDFAGLEWDPACARPDKNRDTVRTASNWQTRQPIYATSVERWRHYEGWLGDLRSLT